MTRMAQMKKGGAQVSQVSHCCHVRADSKEPIKTYEWTLNHKQLRWFSTMRTEVIEEEISQCTSKWQERLCFVVALVCFISSTMLLLSMLLFAHGRVFFLCIFGPKKKTTQLLTTNTGHLRQDSPRGHEKVSSSYTVPYNHSSQLSSNVCWRLFVLSKPARLFNIPKAHKSFIKG